MAVDGDFAGNVLLVGRGAGAGATASAVASDIVDIARGRQSGAVPGAGGASSSPTSAPSSGSIRAPTTCASSVFDRPGAMAGIAGRLGEREVSLESIVQRRPRGSQIGIGAQAQAGRADTGDPHHA